MAVNKKKTTKKVVSKPVAVKKVTKQIGQRATDTATKTTTKKISKRRLPSSKQTPNSWSDFTIEEKKNDVACETYPLE